MSTLHNICTEGAAALWCWACCLCCPPPTYVWRGFFWYWQVWSAIACVVPRYRRGSGISCTFSLKWQPHLLGEGKVSMGIPCHLLLPCDCNIRVCLLAASQNTLKDGSCVSCTLPFRQPHLYFNEHVLALRCPSFCSASLRSHK